MFLKNSLTLVLSSFFLFAVVAVVAPTTSYAANYRDSCLGKYNIDFVNATTVEDKYRIDTSEVAFSVGGPNFTSGKTYELYLAYETAGTNPVDLIDSQVANNGVINFTLKGPNAFNYPNDGVRLNRSNKVLYLGENGERFCTLKKYSVESVASCTFSFDQKGVENTACIDEDGGEVTVRVSDISSPTGIYSGRVTMQVYYSAVALIDGRSDAYTISTSQPGYVEQSVPVYEDRDFWITVGVPSVGLCGTRNKINVVQTCSDEAREEGEGFGETYDPDKEIEATPFKLCDQITNPDLRSECEKCAGSDLQDAAGIWTAVGCIQREPTALISALIQIGLSAAGGVTLLVILAAGFMLTTSQGDPKKAGEAKEMITAAVIGLLFIIFSVTILQFIGYNVLKIPGFGG